MNRITFFKKSVRPVNLKHYNMKKIISFFLLVTMALACFSQETGSSHSLTREDYMKKSKSLHITSVLFLTGGLVLGVTGLVIGLNDFSDLSSDHEGITNAFIVAGVISCMASVVCFSASVKNKRKAQALLVSLKPEKTSILQKSGLVSAYIPAVSLKFSL